MMPQRQKTPPKIDNANSHAKPAVAPAAANIAPVDWTAFLAGMSRGKTILLNSGVNFLQFD